MGCGSSRPEKPNVVVCGHSGAGVSSVVNLITGSNVAPTSTDTQICTTRVSTYPASFDGRSFNVYDVPGFAPAKSPGKFPSPTNVAVICTGDVRNQVNYTAEFLRDQWPYGDGIPVILVVVHSRPYGGDWWSTNMHHFNGLRCDVKKCLELTLGRNEMASREILRARICSLVQRE